MGKWLFAPQSGAEIRSENKDELLFRTEHSGEDEYAGTDSLAREILQNALDAGADQAPVRIRFALHEPSDAPPPERLAHYFSRLQTPLLKRQIHCDANGVPQCPCRFLVVEDFGTRGLEGNPRQHREPQGQESGSESFYWFWRNTGISAKKGNELGRHGLGKLVFRAASQVGCMFGVTIRQSDRRELLMGQAFLHLHEFDGCEYKQAGFWCAGQDENDVPVPIEDPGELALFRQEWRISRTVEPGLSVVSPFVPEVLRADRLAQAVALHFFLRILRGQLVVEITGTKTGKRSAGKAETIILDRERLADACREMDWSGPARTKRHVPPPTDFAQGCMRATPDATTTLLGQDRLPEWNETIVAPDRLAALRNQFARGERVGLRVRLSLPVQSGPPRIGSFDVWVAKTANTKRLDSYYVREGMTITKLTSQACKRGHQGLVLVEAGPLAELLGDCEGPAHEEWDTSQSRPDITWKTWKGRVKFVRRAVDGVVELLTPPVAAADYELLRDFFSIEQPGNRGASRTRGGGVSDPVPLTIPAVPPKWFEIAHRAGGFAIKRGDRNVAIPRNQVLSVRVAYNIPQGDPFHKWTAFDFSFSNMSGRPGELTCKLHGATLNSRIDNQLEIGDFAEDFECEVKGFDTFRDLYIRVDELPVNENEKR